MFCKYHAPKRTRRTYNIKENKIKLGSLIGTDKHESISVNIISVHLFVFIVFVNIFIRPRSKQRTSELSVMATELVFFPT